jgi:hypothetical protein
MRQLSLMMMNKALHLYRPKYLSVLNVSRHLNNKINRFFLIKNCYCLENYSSTGIHLFMEHRVPGNQSATVFRLLLYKKIRNSL